MLKLGVDLGGTNIAAGIVDDNFNIVAKKSIPSGAGRKPEEIIHDIYTLSCQVCKEARISFDDLPFWGIGMPSCVNPATKKLIHANCFGWRNFPIYEYLEKYTNKPIYIENDANCAAYGEVLAGSGRNLSNAVMLTLGTGVGGGIIVDKKIFAGGNHTGAELGHTKIVHDGRLCTCGKKGCLETYASATALCNLAREMGMQVDCADGMYATVRAGGGGQMVGKINGEKIFDAFAKGDETARKVVNKYCDYLADGIASFISIFRPEVVILGGGISGAGELLLSVLRPKVFERTFASEEMGVPDIVCASLGNDAGIIGAAYLNENDSSCNKG